jgi:hypothetical protein
MIRDTRGTYACIAPPGGRCTCDATARHPSVTTILGAVLAKPALIQWAAGCAADEAVKVIGEHDHRLGLGSAEEAITMLSEARQRIASAHVRQRDKAAARGSTVHRVVEALAAGRDPAPSDLTPEVLPYLDALRRFCDAETPIVAHSESVVSSRKGYAGTLDAIHRVPGVGLVIRDWKTRKDEKRARLYGEEVLQLAAYRYATWMRDASGEVRRMPRVDAAEVVLLWPGGYRIERVDACRDAHRIFLHCLDIYRWRTGQQGAT